MKRVSFRVYSVCVFLFLVPSLTWAYLDPGTGSLLVYALVGMLASVAFALRNAFYWLKGLVLSGSRVKIRGNADIVFHSEGGKYWHVFEPVVRAMIELKQPVCYVTPDRSDPAFSLQCEWFSVACPGSEFATIAWMNRVRAKVVVSTTPHLDVYMWKRSPSVGRYVHLFHAPDGIDFYEKYALCFYDDILTVGEFQKAAITRLDSLRNLPPKNFYPVGCTYFDYMLRELGETASEPAEHSPLGSKATQEGSKATQEGSKATQEGSKATQEGSPVLYAPSWGERSSVIKYGTAIIDTLAEAGIPVVFRPHPQYKASHAALLDSMKKKYSGAGLVRIDENRTAIQAMTECDIMIADISGIVFDYAYLFGKPVVLTDPDFPAGGYEAEDAGDAAWTVPALKKLCRVLKEGEIALLPAIVREIRSNYTAMSADLHAFRDAHVHNFGSAGRAAARAICEIAGGVQ